MIRSQWFSPLLAGLLAVPAALAIELNIDDPSRRSPHSLWAMVRG